MAFGIDYNNVQQGGIIAAGTYEMIIKEAKISTTKGGKEYINISMVVRNDVAQKYQNVYLWHSLWKRKEPGKQDMACDGYSAAQINTISKAAALPDGKQYKSLGEWLAELKNRPIRVKVKHGEFNNEPRAEAEKIEETQNKICKHVWKEKNSNSIPKQTAFEANLSEVDFDTITDDDFPF